MVGQLREQVNNVMAAVQLLTPLVREQGDRRYDQYLAIASQSLYRLLRLTNNVEFAQRTQRGEAAAAFRPVVLDAAGFCRELGRQVEPLAAKAGVGFRCEEDAGCLLLRADPPLLRRMLLNLITNALQAAGQGGQAGIRLSGGRERIVFTVWDNGRRDAQDGERAAGPSGRLGLGLTIARQIAALHGGTIVFERRGEQGGRSTASLASGKVESGGLLRTPPPIYDPTGGFSPVLVELADVLPYEAFTYENME